MGCVNGKAERVYTVVPADEAEIKKENGLPTPQPVIVSRDDYKEKHEGARNQGESLPSPPTAPEPNGDFKSKVEEELLKVVNVDLRIAENVKAHHTDRYQQTLSRQAPAVNPPTTSPNSNPPAVTPAPETLDPCLVVRRGEPFDIVIKFDRPFDQKKDDIRLVFDFGDNPRESRGTLVVLLLSDEDEPKKWGAKLMNQEGETFTIRIFTPSHVAVNKWKFSFDTVHRSDDKCQIFRHPRSFFVYILFNPWCVDDQVFMSDESSRNEYVLNDCGRIFYGTYLNISAMPWNFGQFEDFVLDVALLLLDISGINSSLRGNSIHVVRNISAMTNAPDDNGVIFGNWSGDYSDGTSPVAWNGSVAILDEYWKKKEPVRYGQCWVFSATVTTICRALGIPCRSVTNFVCAHDTDGSLTVDAYWDADGKPLEKYNQDTIWNFHVWNEVWMLRPDLPSGFGGWQAIDATPQEASEGVYCTGPASLEAVKNGLVQLPYDGTFIFAEVNADRIHCIQTKDGTWTRTFQENYIGKNISTKGPDGDERLDITSLYKFSEDSPEERTAVWRAVSNSSSPRKTLYKVEAEDVDFSLVQKESVVIGKPFDVILKIQNKSADQKRTVKATLSSSVVQYTGVPIASIKSYSQTVILKPNAEAEVKMTVTVKEYLNKVGEMCHVKMSSMSQVEETKQFHCDSDDFRFTKPTIHIKVPLEMKLGEEYEIEASFTNPLPKTLTQCEFSFEAANLLRPLKLSHTDVAPQGVLKSSTKLTPQMEGDTEVIIGFWSKELSDLTESVKVKMFEELIFRVVLDVDPNLDPAHVHVQLWTNQRDRQSPEGDWHGVKLQHRGQHSDECHVYGARVLLVALGEYQFLYRAKTDCERDWRQHPSEGEPGRFRVDPPRCPETFACSLRVPDASHVVGPLHIGNESAAVNAVRDCFTHVLCAAAELGQPFDNGAGVAFHKVPVMHGIENWIGDEIVCDAVYWLRSNWKQNRKILVYCKYGFSRAGSIVLAFVLDQKRDMAYDDALQHLYDKRPVFPHAGLRDALLRMFPRETTKGGVAVTTTS